MKKPIKHIVDVGPAPEWGIELENHSKFEKSDFADWGKGSEADSTLVPGFIVQIGVDTRCAKEREKIDAKHKKWLKVNEGLD